MVAAAKQTPARRRDPRWSAVRRRDTRADGQFVYAVSTTGIYCRPSCASRPARREHVTFHDNAAAAQAAGFRACKRCRPDSASVTDRHATAVIAACRSIDAADTALSLASLARTAGLSPFHFQRVFKHATGLTPKQYAGAQRAERVRAALRVAPNVTDALYSAGYGSNSRFYEEADRRLGMAAGTYRAGGRGARIRYATGKCSLGAVLVAATDLGVCSILLGAAAAQLERDLRQQFPEAELIGADRDFKSLVGRVIRLIDTPDYVTDLPLDIRGTAFQRQVWAALAKIPSGRTLSYAQLAAQIGRPRAVRAVAGACAANRLAVAIPCHRAVRSDGSLAGYRWGAKRKRTLLERERRADAARGPARAS